MKIYWVYMLLCFDGTYYVGFTGNIEKRVAEHEIGAITSCYTFMRRPVKLIYSAEFYDPNEAIAWEKRLKSWSHAKKRALARGTIDLLKKGASTDTSQAVRDAGP